MLEAENTRMRSEKRTEVCDAVCDSYARENQQLSDRVDVLDAENHALKLAAAGGEDVPGSAQMVTAADVAQWRQEAAGQLRDAEREIDALRLLLRNEVRVGRQRELLQENNKLLDRARAAEARASRFWAALGCLFPFVDRAVGEGIVFGPDGDAPAIDALDAYMAAGQALGCEELDNPILLSLSAPSDEPRVDPVTVPVLYLNHRGDLGVRYIVPLRFWQGESKWHPGERHFLRVVEPVTEKVRDFALSGIIAWGHAAIDRVESLDRGVGAQRAELAAERDAKAFQNRAGASGRATRAQDGEWGAAENQGAWIK